MIKNFVLLKNTQKKEGSKQPDYNISFEEDGTWINGGGCWKKTDKSGNTMLSCTLREPYEDKPGFHIEQDSNSPVKSQNDL